MPGLRADKPSDFQSQAPEPLIFPQVVRAASTIPFMAAIRNGLPPPPSGRLLSFNIGIQIIQQSRRIMAVGLSSSRHAAEEEARAEVDVLNSRLEKTAQLTKKIEGCLGRLEATGKSVRDVVAPLNGETKNLQILGNSQWLSCADSKLWFML